MLAVHYRSADYILKRRTVQHRSAAEMAKKTDSFKNINSHVIVIV
jgi:hypothetical protein